MAMKPGASRGAPLLAIRPSIKVEPIRRPEDIARIKGMLEGDARDWGLFVFGINTGFRASELVSIRLGDVAHLRTGDYFEIKEPKTGRYRGITLNNNAAEAIRRCIEVHPGGQGEDSLFWSKKTGGALRPASIYRLVKGWCADAGLNGRFGSHTLRKTWGYQQRTQFGVALSLLTRAYGHASERQTLEYLCIQPGEIQDLFLNEI